MPLDDVCSEDILQAIPEVETILRRVPDTGQKAVYECIVSGKRCALKLVALSGDPDDEDEDALLRVQREVGLMGRCLSPHLPRVGPLDLNEASVAGCRVVFFTEEWIAGTTLKAIIERDGCLPPVEVLTMAQAVTSAVDELWGLRVVHRDIKPANIVRADREERYVLLDMGMALAPTEPAITTLHGVVGTLGYWSPEQLDGTPKSELDFRADLFVLGIVMYESLTGAHPYLRKRMSFDQCKERIISAAPPRPSQVRRAVSLDVDSIVVRLLQPRRHLRYRSCRAALDALGAAVAALRESG